MSVKDSFFCIECCIVLLLFVLLIVCITLLLDLYGCKMQLNKHIYHGENMLHPRRSSGCSICTKPMSLAGADPGFQVRGAHLKKLRRAEGDSNMFGVFRVKNHDFTPKKSYFFQLRREARKFWGISCEKSRSYAKKNHIFSNFRGGGAPGAPPAGSAPG